MIFFKVKVSFIFVEIPMEAQFFLHASPCPQPLYWPQSSNIMKNLVLSLLPKSPQSRVSELFFPPTHFSTLKNAQIAQRELKWEMKQNLEPQNWELSWSGLELFKNWWNMGWCIHIKLGKSPGSIISCRGWNLILPISNIYHWTNLLTPVSLHFLMFKMRTWKSILTSQVYREDYIEWYL